VDSILHTSGLLLLSKNEDGINVSSILVVDVKAKTYYMIVQILLMFRFLSKFLSKFSN